MGATGGEGMHIDHVIYGVVDVDASAEVGEPPALLDAWLGDHGLPVRHAAGPVGISAVTIATDRGEAGIH
jgi:hypothetical protein